MLDLFEKIEEFFKDIMIDVIKDNLSAMLVDINDKVSTVAVEVGKTPGSWNSEVFAFIKSINENIVLPIAAIILTAILCIELIQVVVQKNSMHDTDTFEFFKYIINHKIYNRHCQNRNHQPNHTVHNGIFGFFHLS
mgnify:FL=1